MGNYNIDTMSLFVDVYRVTTYLHYARAARQILGYVSLVQRPFENGFVIVDVLQINNQRYVGTHTRRAHISSAHCQPYWTYRHGRFFVSLFNRQSLVIQRVRGRNNAAFRVDCEISRKFARYQSVNHLAVSRSCTKNVTRTRIYGGYNTFNSRRALLAFCLCYR